MNNYISSLIVRFISLTLLFTGTLSASESIQLHHSVAVYTNAGAFNEVTLSIHITNTSNTDFKHVKLTPSGKEFSVGETTKEINIGYLPAQSESIIQWTASTPLAIEYFETGMPVFFRMKTNEYSNKKNEIALYSLGGK